MNKILITMPESLGDCLHLTCLLRDAREQYPNHKIFVATKEKFFEVFLPLVGKYIDYVIEWLPEFDHPYTLEGYGGSPKVFDVVLNAHFPTQKLANYLHNGLDKTAINYLHPCIN